MIRNRAFKFKRSRFLPLFLPLMLAGAGLAFSAEAAPTPPDTIMLNGAIYTVNKANPWAEAVAIADGKFVAVGTSADVKKLAGPKTKIVDLKGAMAMPGINDGHVHPVWGAMARLYTCQFGFSSTPDQISKAIEACVKRNPKVKWMKGGQWDSNFFGRFKIASPREFLDKVSGNVAVVLTDDSGHNSWANTKALELAGITEKTPDVTGGKIERGKDGKPNGVLTEAAASMMEKAVPDWDHAEYVKGVYEAVHYANSFGVTGMKNADAHVPELDAMKAVDDAGGMTVHFAAAINTGTEDRNKLLDYNAIDKLRDKYKSKHVDTSFIKIFLDGVPTPARTALMLEPYTPDPHFPKDYRGAGHIPPAILAKDIIELDKRGYTVKMHAAGDGSVEEGLDAVEAARKANGNKNLRHELAHAGFISDKDFPRFKALNVVADLSPYLWHPSSIMNAVLVATGERGKHYWPIHDLVASSTPVLAGSDWPAAVETINPWNGVEAMVTRQDPTGQFPGSQWPEEAITLDQALHIFTLDGAKALKLGNQTGSIEVGKSADLIVLDHNLFKEPIHDVHKVKVVSTYFEGKPVYSAAPAK
jgi:predicted amidohydrolase YtcJ